MKLSIPVPFGTGLTLFNYTDFRGKNNIFNEGYILKRVYLPLRNGLKSLKKTGKSAYPAGKYFSFYREKQRNMLDKPQNRSYNNMY